MYNKNKRMRMDNISDIILALETLRLKVNLLTKSKFYYNMDGELREHIANYNGYAILLKQEKLPKKLSDKETEMYPAIVTLKELKKYKKVNGNIVRKINPSTINKFNKIILVQEVIKELDSLKL